MDPWGRKKDERGVSMGEIDWLLSEFGMTLGRREATWAIPG